jgi:hypothetical protein
LLGGRDRVEVGLSLALGQGVTPSGLPEAIVSPV